MRRWSSMSVTGMDVARPRISASMLTRPGARCWMYTNARPVLLGTALRNSVKASRPPAEAPTPTMATGLSPGGGGWRGGPDAADSRGAGAGRGAAAFFALDLTGDLGFIAGVRAAASW